MSKRIRVTYDEGSDEERRKKKKRKEKELLSKRPRKKGDILIRKIDSTPIDKEVLDAIYKNDFHEIFSIPNHFIGIVSYEEKEEICIYEQIEDDLVIHTTDDVLATGNIVLICAQYRLIHLLIWTYKFLGKEVPLYVRYRNGNRNDLSPANISFTVCKRRPANIEYESFTIVNKFTNERFTAETLLDIGLFLGINHQTVKKRLTHRRHYIGWELICNDRKYCVENDKGEKHILPSTKELSKLARLIIPPNKNTDIKRKISQYQHQQRSRQNLTTRRDHWRIYHF